MKTERQIKNAIKKLTEGRSAKELRNSPRRRNKILALEWVLGNVSDL